MSIFRRDQPESEPVGSPPSASPAARPSNPRRGQEPRPQTGRATHIASGTVVAGRISGPTSVLIEGRLEGEIELDRDLRVGSGGEVVGDISAQSVEISGQVRGNIRGAEKVEIAASGRLEGDVAAPQVILAEGAFFRGRVEMTGQRPKPSQGSEESKSIPASSSPQERKPDESRVGARAAGSQKRLPGNPKGRGPR